MTPVCNNKKNWSKGQWQHDKTQQEKGNVKREKEGKGREETKKKRV